MTKLEAVQKTIKQWKKLKVKNRDVYSFSCHSCYLCGYSKLHSKSLYQNCRYCPWSEAYGWTIVSKEPRVRFSAFTCAQFIARFQDAGTDEEAGLWKDTVIGMLLCLESEIKKEIKNG